MKATSYRRTRRLAALREIEASGHHACKSATVLNLPLMRLLWALVVGAISTANLMAQDPEIACQTGPYTYRQLNVNASWIETPPAVEEDNLMASDTSCAPWSDLVSLNHPGSFTEAVQNTEVTAFAISGNGSAYSSATTYTYSVGGGFEEEAVGYSDATSELSIEFTVPVDAVFHLGATFDFEGSHSNMNTGSGYLSVVGATDSDCPFPFETAVPEVPDSWNRACQGTALAGQAIRLVIQVETHAGINDMAGDSAALFEFSLSFRPELVGLEAVQVVQDWENSIPLVTHKGTLVRAHFQKYPNPIQPLLRGYRGGVELPNSPLKSKYPGPSLTPPHDAQKGRAKLYDNAAWGLPFSWVSDPGPIELAVELVDEDQGLICSETAGPVVGDCRATVSLQNVDMLPVNFVRVQWTDDKKTVHLPSSTFALEQMARLRTSFPLHNVEMSESILVLAEKSLPKTAPTLDRIAQLRASDGCNAGCDRIYYGLTSGGPVRGQAQSIGGVNGLSALGNGYPMTISHEIGHLMGRPHVTHPTFGHTPYGGELGACCSISEGSDFPDYLFENVGAGNEVCDGIISTSQGLRPTLGEIDDGADKKVYGWDNFRHAVVDGERIFDVMSYCSDLGWADRWPSRFTYSQLLAVLPGGGASASGPAAGAMGVAADHLLVSGSVNFALDSGEIGQVHRVPGIQAIPAVPGDYLLRTRNAMGVELAAIAFSANSSVYVDGEEANTGWFWVYVPHDPQTHSIEIDHGGMILDTRTASANPPTVQVLAPNGGEVLDTDIVAISWAAQDLDGDTLESMVQYSSDSGATWSTIATQFAGQSLEIPRDGLAGSDLGLLRVQVSDGFHHASDESDATFSVVNNPPVVDIGDPVAGSDYWNGQVVNFDAIALDKEDGLLSGASLQWNSSLDGPIGSGEQIEVPAANLTAGQHIITVVAVDSNGEQTSDSINLWIETAPAIFSNGFE